MSLDWVNQVVCKPYLAGASGPDKFDCVGLVHWYFKHQLGRELSLYTLEVSDGQSLRAFVRSTGFRPVNGRPRHGDLMTMESWEGRHVGIVVESNEGLGLLHAVGRQDKGMVVWQPLDTLVTFKRKRLWRDLCN